MVVAFAWCTTILDDTEVGAAVPTPLTPAAAQRITRFLNHEVHPGGQRGDEAQAAWVEREMLEPLVWAGNLRGLCELCEGAAFLGANTVQRACVAEMARTVEGCRTAEEVRECFGLGAARPSGARRPLWSGLRRWRPPSAAIAWPRALLRPPKRGRRGLPEPGPGGGGLPGDDSGIDHGSDEPALRAACAAGDGEVVLDVDITRSGDC